MGSTRQREVPKVVAPACMAWIIGGIKTALPYRVGCRDNRRDARGETRCWLSAQRCGIAVRHDIALRCTVHSDAAGIGSRRNGSVGRATPAALAPCRGVISHQRSAWSSVGKRFVTRDREVEALQPIDLSIQDHEFVALVGPSGCGKSTILNLIAGLLQPSWRRGVLRRGRGKRAQSPGRLHDAEGHAAAVAHRSRQHPHRAGTQVPCGASRRGQCPRETDHRTGRADRFRAPLSRGTLRRHAQARRPGAHA